MGVLNRNLDNAQTMTLNKWGVFALSLALVFVFQGLSVLGAQSPPATSGQAVSSNGVQPTLVVSPNAVPSGIHFGHPGEASGVSQQTPPGASAPLANPPYDWAFGAYSTNLHASNYSAVWSHLASSYTLTNVNYAGALLNVPYNATGTIACSGKNYNIYGELFQAVIVYQPTVAHSIPSWEVLFMVKPVGGGANNICYGPVYFAGGSWGSSLASPVTQKLVYTTHNGYQGWWYNIILANGSSYYLAGAAGASTATTQTAAGASFNPSIAFEVNEVTSGNFLTANPNFDIQANALVFGYYGKSGTPLFDIGANAAPATAYGSGLTYTVQGAYQRYYGEFGTSAGITNWMSTKWGISNPVKTQTGGTYLPLLNLKVVSNILLTMAVSGGPSGFISPLPGIYGPYTLGAQVPITASNGTCREGLSRGLIFDGWTGTGSGSYSGFSYSATVTMNSNITETAKYINSYCPQ